MDTEFTFENSFTTLLNKKGREIIDKQLEDLKCQQCGKSIFRVTYMEGDNIHCKKRGGWHDTGYEIDVNSNPPRIIDNILLNNINKKGE